jgi:hypothetical protein
MLRDLMRHLLLCISDFQQTFHTQYTGMFIALIRTKINTPRCNALLVIAIKPHAEETFRTPSWLLCSSCIPPHLQSLNKNSTFFEEPSTKFHECCSHLTNLRVRHFIITYIKGERCPCTRHWSHYCLTAKESNPGTHWVGGSIIFRAVLGVLEKRTISCLCRESHHGSSVVQPVA